MESCNNVIKVSGELGEANFSHEVVLSDGVKKMKMYETVIQSVRLSGVVDFVPVILNEHVLGRIGDRKRVELTGEIRTYNEGKHLKMFVYVTEVKDSLETQDINEFLINGFICKPPVHRKTPQGKLITDLILAVNQPNKKCNYIPAITWGNISNTAKSLGVGQEIHVTGRFQSRTYLKKYDDGSSEHRTAYEISICNLATIENIKEVVS